MQESNKLNHYQRVKSRVMDKLGRKCAICGYDADERALQIDHVRNNGNEHRRIHRPGTVQYIRDIEKSIDNGENAYQILCANCNAIKASQDRGLITVIAEQIKLLSLVDFTCEINRVIEGDK
jgi:5-methylcytosine-specific restriction endonuclease McrA